MRKNQHESCTPFGDYMHGHHFVLKGSDEISFFMYFFNICNFRLFFVCQDSK